MGLYRSPFLGSYVKWKLANCSCTLECLVKLFWTLNVWEGGWDDCPEQILHILVKREPM